MEMYAPYQYHQPYFANDFPCYGTEYLPCTLYQEITAGHWDSPQSLSAEQQAWLRLTEQRRLDQEFLTLLVNAKQSERRDDRITIGRYKSQCSEAHELLQWLRSEHQKLGEHWSDETGEEWAETSSKISAVKKQLQDILQRLDQEKAAVTKLVEKRRKKRRWEKRKREQAEELDREVQERRDSLEIAIDAWRHKQVEQEQKDKRDKETKREADLVLGEVLRKKSEAQQSLQILQSLAKLREIRLKARQNTHGFRADLRAAEYFEKTTGDLKRLMENQLANYDKEEATLRNMLESK